MQRKIIHICLALAAIATLAYLLMLGYFALPTADDWGWARQVSDLNPFGFVKAFYFGWQGRFSALLIDGALCKYLGWNEHLLGFAIVELLLGYGAVYLLLRDMLSLRNNSMLAIVSIVVTNLGVMAFPEIGTFYWLCTTNYVHEIWFTLYLVWFMFFCQYTWLSWGGTILCALYLGGCAENYSPVLALVLGCYWVWRMMSRHDWRFWEHQEDVRLIVATMLIGVGFLAMLFAPGNDVRMASEGSYSMMNHFNLSLFIIKTCKASVVLLLRLASRGWYFICALPLFVLLGAMVNRDLPKLTWKRSIVSLLIAMGPIVISVAASVYGVGWYATMRANCFIVFIMMAWVAYVGVLIGNQLKESEMKISVVTMIASIAIIATSITYISIEYPIVRRYNQEVLATHHRLQHYVSDGRKETVYVKPVQLPCRQTSYGYLRNMLQVVFHKSKRYHECYFPYEPFRLEADSHDWRNLFYQSWLGAEFEIICTDEENQ